MDYVKTLRNWSIGCDTSRPDFKAPERSRAEIHLLLPDASEAGTE